MSFANERAKNLLCGAVTRPLLFKVFFTQKFYRSLYLIFRRDFFMFNFLATAPFDFSAIFGNIVKRWYYYLALLIAICLIIVFALFKKQNRNTLTHTQKLVYTAILSALSFVANYFTIKVSDAWQISLVATVGFTAGYMLGAGLGFTAAFVGDLLCGIVAPFGAYNPIIGVGTGLWGFIPGVIFTCFKGNDMVKLVISYVLGFVLNSFLINTFGLSVMYSMTFESLLVLLPFKLITVAINVAVCIALVQLLKRILHKSKFTFVTKASKTE